MTLGLWRPENLDHLLLIPLGSSSSESQPQIVLWPLLIRQKSPRTPDLPGLLSLTTSLELQEYGQGGNRRDEAERIS